LYVEGSGSSVAADGVGIAGRPGPGALSCWVGSIDVVDMTKLIPGISIVCSSILYDSCKVISYDYIDSKHNMIEIHREMRELPDAEGEGCS
jgi:hypothetical protein